MSKKRQSKEFLVRQANARADFMRITELDARLFPGAPLSAICIRQYLDLFSSLSFVGQLDDDTNIAAYSITGISNTGIAWLLSVCTAPELRRLGVGEMIIERTVEKLIENEISEYCLTVSPENTAARRLFEKSGFCECGCEESYFGAGEDRVIMRRVLR